MKVTYFRPRRPGPEALIENAVLSQIPQFFPNDGRLMWAAGSIPIGAGVPDLAIVSCEPQVFALAQVEMPTTQILAYLRAVGRARLDTITERVRLPREIVIRCLNDLVEIQVVVRDLNTFSLSQTWREILPEIVAVEAKVTNWKRAIDQAARNRIFAHRSFVALPDRVAQRVRLEPIFRQLGIGLLSVGDKNAVSVLRRSRRRQPRVWTYYYEIASLVATHLEDNSNAIRCTVGTGSN